MKRMMIFLGFLISFSAFSQETRQTHFIQDAPDPEEKQRDSLRLALQKLPADSSKVLTWLALARTYNFSGISMSIPVTDSAMKLATSLHWLHGMARANIQLGKIAADSGDNLLSNVYYQKALDLDQKTGNMEFVSKDLSNLALAYNRESDFPNALKMGLQAVGIAESLHKDSVLANAIGDVVITYLNHKNYPKGTEWALRAKDLAERTHSQGDLVDALQHLAYIRYHEKNKPEVKKLLRQALAVARTLNEPVTVASVLSQLGEAEIDSPATALKHLYEARDILKRNSPKSMRFADAQTTLGKLLGKMAITASGPEKKRLLDSAIANELRAEQILLHAHNRQYLCDVYDFLSEYQAELGNFKASYDYDLRSAKIYDSLFSEKKKREISDLQSRHDLEIKDRELQVRKLEAANRRRILVALTGGISLLIVIAALLVWQNGQRRKANTTLLVLNNQLEEANKIKARFFGILSHDLRSPIANLLRFLTLVKNDPGAISPEQKEEHQQEISRSAEELLETMEAMLLWSKEQMDSFKPEIRNISVAALFDYLQKFFARERNVILKFHNPGKMMVTGDENYLRVIMQNLTSNAFKALRNNPAGVVEWKAVQKGEQTILSVTDNGPGLNKEQAKALYTETNSVNAGSGFGFHLVRDLAKAIQFTIAIDSQPGKGTTFLLQS